MKTIHFDPSTMPEEARAIFAHAFPGYTGKKFKLRPVSGPVNVCSYWSGGSRDYYAIVSQVEKFDVPQQSQFDQQLKGADSVTIPEGACIVQHSIFCGKDHGLTIIIPAERAAALLPAAGPDLTTDQLTVLGITARLKAFARRETAEREGINAERWAEIVDSLKPLGLLRSNGSITPAGRNVAPDRIY